MNLPSEYLSLSSEQASYLYKEVRRKRNHRPASSSAVNISQTEKDSVLRGFFLDAVVIEMNTAMVNSQEPRPCTRFGEKPHIPAKESMHHCIEMLELLCLLVGYTCKSA
jgi:hypothetical protein